MVHIFIGLFVGIIMGLTGAGGALVSIPLFMQFLDVPLKEASVLSLIPVVFGTGVNLLGSFKKVDRRLMIALALSGALGNLLTIDLKEKTPEVLIAFLLLIIGSFSIWSIWTESSKKELSESVNKGIFQVVLTGGLLGVLTTLTGLGGGVVLIPILIKNHGKAYLNALPTALGTIFLISLNSLILQDKHGLEGISSIDLFFIALGTLLSLYFLKSLSLLFKDSFRLKLQKVVFTLVTLYVIFSVLVQVFRK